MKHQQIEGCANGTALAGQNLCRSLRANQVDPIEVPKIDTINSTDLVAAKLAQITKHFGKPADATERREKAAPTKPQLGSPPQI